MRAKLAILIVAIAALSATPAFAGPAAVKYVLSTAHAARQLQGDYRRMRVVWNRTSYQNDYNAAVVFYEQVVALQYQAAPQPSSSAVLSRAYLPENELWLTIMEMPTEIQVIEDALLYSFERPLLKSSVQTFNQNVATYNSNLIQVWSLAHVPNPPVL
jgi:hypothetical protein